MSKLLSTLSWLCGLIAIFLMLLYLNLKIGSLSLSSATNFIDSVIISRFPDVRQPINFYMGIASLLLGLSLFIRMMKEKYFIKDETTVVINSIPTLKVFHCISRLMAYSFVIIALMTFYLIEFRPLLLLNNWVLTHFLDDQKNKLSLFYMIHGFLLISVTGYLKSLIDKQEKIAKLTKNRE